MSEYTLKNNNSEVLLSVKHLRKEFPIKQTIFDIIQKKEKKKLTAVDDVSIDIYKGENLGIVGESGCGKTTFAKSAIQLYKPNSGEVFFEGTDITKVSKRELRKLCRNFQMIFQDPFSSLNPRMSVRDVLSEALTVHKIVEKNKVNAKIADLIDMVGLNIDQLDRFPGEFSGGQQQRIGIARALALNPKLIIADEPVSALDVSIQAQIINLIKDLQERLGITFIFISHDLRVVRYVTTRVVVMYLGKIIETSDTEELYHNPLHPYTKILLESNPNLDPRKREKKSLIEGEPPSPIDLPKGCRFCKRCKYAMDICHEKEPDLKEILSGHKAACFKL